MGALVGICLLVGLSSHLAAQDVTSLSDLVTDASGPVVVSADVVLVDSFGLPGGRFGGTADITDQSTFGFISTPASTARFMQFALRSDF
jgi:hypothetical protein